MKEPNPKWVQKSRCTPPTNQHQVSLTCGRMHTYPGQMYPPLIEPSGTEHYYTRWVWCGRIQTYQGQMYPSPSTDIWWPRAVLCNILTFSRMQLRMQWTGRCTPLLVASGGQEQYYVRSSLHSEECNWECWLTFTFALYRYVTHRNGKSYIFWSCLQHASIIQDPESRQPPKKHISWYNRQVTQITYAALYKHLALFSVTLYSCVSTWPHHIFLHQMYRNAIRTISNPDQFTHILPWAV